MMTRFRHRAQQVGDALIAEFRCAGTNARAPFLNAENRGGQLSGGF